MTTKSQLIVSVAIGVVLGLGLILAGQPLLLSGARPTSAASPVAMNVVHEVRPGESLQKIAELHHVRPGAIIIANQLADLAPPEPGTQLVVPVIEPTSTPLKSSVRGMTTAGTVLGRAGDTPAESGAARTPSSSSVVPSTPVDPTPSPGAASSDGVSTALGPRAAETPDTPSHPPLDAAGTPAKGYSSEKPTATQTVTSGASPTQVAAPDWTDKAVDQALTRLAHPVTLDAPSASAIASRPGTPGVGPADAATGATAYTRTSGPAPAVAITSLHSPTPEASDVVPAAAPSAGYSERWNTVESAAEATLLLVAEGIVMAWPCSGSQQLGVLPAGSVVTTNGRLADLSWWEVPYAGGPNDNGWLQASVVRPNVAASSVPAYALATATPASEADVVAPSTTD